MNAQSLDTALQAVETFKHQHKAELAAMQDQIEAIKLFGGTPRKGAEKKTEAPAAAKFNKAPAIIQASTNELASWDSFIRKGTAFTSDMQASMSVDSQPAGGYLTPAHFSSRLTSTLFESSPILQIARHEVIDEDAFVEGLDKDESAASWVSERQSRAETDTPTVGEQRIPLHELYANPAVTQKLLDTNSFNADVWLERKISDKFSRTLNTAFVSGDGDGKPRGFLTYDTAATADDTREWGVIEHVNTGASGAFAADPDGTDVLEDALAALKSGYRAGALWLMNRRVLAALRKLKTTDGYRLVEPSIQIGGLPNLLGYGVMIAEDMPDLGANSLSIAFGNWQRCYCTVSHRKGGTIMRDPFTNKPYVHFYSYSRAGGDVLNFEAVKLVRFGS